MILKPEVKKDLSPNAQQVVLLRGLARESRHWGNFPEQLVAAGVKVGLEFRVELIDLPGCGRHSEMLSPTVVEEMAEFARDQLSQAFVRASEAGLSTPKRRHLIAMSLGGMVAASWVDRFPHDFSSLVLMNSSFRGLSPATQRLKVDSWWRLPVIMAEKDLAKREYEILRWISNDESRRKAVLGEWVAIQQSRPVSLLNTGCQLLAASRFTAPEELQIPVFVLSSEKDRMVDPRCSAAIAKRYGASHSIHPTAGHDLTLDAGAWAATMVAEWGKECEKANLSSVESSIEETRIKGRPTQAGL
jgi:pimeloyl-ACP methyl ester carboxylesterase